MIKDRPPNVHHGVVSARDFEEYLEPSEAPRTLKGRNLTRVMGEFAAAVLAYKGTEALLSGFGSSLISDTLPRLAQQQGLSSGLARRALAWGKNLVQELDDLEGLVTVEGGKKIFSYELAEAGSREFYMKYARNKLARWMRVLPATLPSAYLTNRLIVQPPGHRLGDRIRSGEMKWYNPVDWMTDFAQVASQMTLFTGISAVGLPMAGKYAMPHLTPYTSQVVPGFLEGLSETMSGIGTGAGNVRAGLSGVLGELGPASPGRAAQMLGGKSVTIAQLKAAYQRGVMAYSSGAGFGPIPGRLSHALSGIYGDFERQPGYAYSRAERFMLSAKYKQVFVRNLMKAGVPPETAAKIAAQVKQTGIPHGAEHELFTFAGHSYSTVDEMTDIIDKAVKTQGLAWGTGKSPGSDVIHAAVRADKFMNNNRSDLLGGMQGKLYRTQTESMAKAVSYAGVGKAAVQPGDQQAIAKSLAEFFGVNPADDAEVLAFWQRGNWTTDRAYTYLQNRGVIQGASGSFWSLLGIQPMTARMAYDRGLMAEPELVESFLRGKGAAGSIPEEMRNRVLSGVKGLFVDQQGRTINFSRGLESLFGTNKSLTSFLSEDIKLPILRFNPRGLFGYPTQYKAQQMPWLEFHQPYSHHPGMGGMITEPFMSYKTSALKRGIYYMKSGVTDPRQYRAYQTSWGTAAGRLVQFLGGMQGPISQTPVGRVKGALDISPEQPRSMWDAMLRYVNRDTSVADRLKSSRMPGFLKQHLGGIASKISRDPADILYAPGVFKSASSFSASPEQQRKALNLLSELTRKGNITPETLKAGNLSVYIPHVSDASAAKAEIQKIIKASWHDIENMPEYRRRVFYTLRNNLEEIIRNERHIHNPSKGSSIFGGAQFRQMEAIRGNIQKWYLMGTVQGEQGLNVMWRNLQDLARKGLISQHDLRKAEGLFIATRTSMISGAKDVGAGLRGMSADWGDRFMAALERGSRIPKWQPHRPMIPWEPVAAGENVTFLPTTRSLWQHDKRATLKGIMGMAGPKRPETLSAGAIPMAHLVARLDRYREFLGLGLDWSKYTSPIDMFLKGWILKGMLPLTLGVGALMATHDIFQEMTGTSPLKGLARAGIVEPRIQAAGLAEAAGLQPRMARAAEIMGFDNLPLSRTKEEERKRWEEGEVAIRRGRWWPLGNTPFRGQRIEYFMPNWYRRLEARDERTSMLYGSTPERLWYNWGPGKFMDPYHWESKWYTERPYPVTGEMFTGPWGPVTSFLNLTVGSALKPRQAMHEQELEEAMQQGGVGVPTALGMQPSIAEIYNRGRLNITHMMTMSGMMGYGGAPTTPVISPVGVPGTTSQATKRQLAFLNQYYTTVADMPVATTGMGTPVVTGASGKTSGTVGVSAVAGEELAGAVVAGGGMPLGGTAQARPPFSAGIPYPNYPVLSPMRMAPLQERLLFPEQTAKPGMVNTFSEFGYQLQEMAGIYGFGFGAMRTMFGGEQDFSPRHPLYQSASRMYGAERSFWDLGLGGLGDVNMAAAGEYSNLELSELIRRFIPHRRRQILEYNPIPNMLGQRHPWLPSNYFINFHTGDPYTEITRGEYRLPGAANLALYGSHPDAYGSPYGLEDITRVLSDIAPWSDEYRMAMQLARRSDLPTDARDRIATYAQQVADKKKKYEFHPYRFAKQDFVDETVTVTGVVQGNPNLFTTKEHPGHPLRLAGVRFPTGDYEVSDAMAAVLAPGTRLQVTRDESLGKPWLPNREQTIDVVAYRGGKSINEWALERGLGTPAKTENAIDSLVKFSDAERRFGAAWERFAHLDTPLHTKFLPIRTAQEEYERKWLYGKPFQQWQHPIESFIKPHMYKNIGYRGPVGGAVAGGIMGYLFGATRATGAKLGAAGAIVGGAAGAYGSAYRALHGGKSWVPLEKREQMAVDEYMDILEYVKWSKLYHQYRIQALQQEGFDAQAWLQENKESAARVLRQEEIHWQAAEIGSRPQSSPATKAFQGMGPTSTMAVLAYQRAKSTAYGSDLFGDWVTQYMAFDKRRRPFFNEWAEAPKKDRKRILSGLPRLERRILEAKWGMPIEPKPGLIDYFSKHELPPPNWEGWMPEVDLEQIKLKVIKNEGLDYHDFGYYPQQMQEAETFNYAYPEFGQGMSKRSARSKLENLFVGAGVPSQILERPSLAYGAQLRVG